MAVRKETIKQQFTQALPSVLEPGERVEAATYLVSGPSPMWVAGIFGVIGMLLLNVRYYFVAVTDRRVIFYAASFWSGRPKGLAWADPRGSVSISDVVTDAKLWNHLSYARPGLGKPLRLNVHTFWREEMKAVVAVLTTPPAPGAWMPPPPQ
jgi:hypothetical protein